MTSLTSCMLEYAIKTDDEKVRLPAMAAENRSSRLDTFRNRYQKEVPNA